MDAIKNSNDFKLVGSQGDGIQHSHLQLNSIASNSQSNVVESIDSSSEAQSLMKIDDLLMDSTLSETQSIVFYGDAQVENNHASNSKQLSYDPQVAYVGNAQAVDNCISNSEQFIYDPQVAYVVPSSSNFNNSFVYNGVTYYSYEAFELDYCKQLIREMQMDGALPKDEDINSPQFSNCMVFATGGSPAIINPHNGLPWRKGANLCRPYMDEVCCHFGTACIFHHPWPPIEDHL